MASRGTFSRTGLVIPLQKRSRPQFQPSNSQLFCFTTGNLNLCGFLSKLLHGWSPSLTDWLTYERRKSDWLTVMDARFINPKRFCVPLFPLKNKLPFPLLQNITSHLSDRRHLLACSNPCATLLLLSATVSKLILEQGFEINPCHFCFHKLTSGWRWDRRPFWRHDWKSRHGRVGQNSLLGLKDTSFHHGSSKSYPVLVAGKCFD